MALVLMLSLAAVVLVASSRANAGASSGPGSGGSFRVDAVFDSAKGIVPGQLVKIAGARVGTVSNVSLTPDFKARIEMTVDGRFAPFRTDAACAIKPEGLIAENFVDCNPGTPAAPELRPSKGHAATVALDRNSEPVSITDLFNIWNTPTRDRLRILINELGAGFAGRGDELNQVLQRANPALAVARKAIALVNRQRVQLERIVSNTDPIVAELARRSPAVQRFVDNAASVAQTTADHRTKLAEGVRRLPGLLAATRPALRQLDVVAAAGAPVLSDLRSSTHGLTRALRDVAPFTAVAIPALNRISPALDRAGGSIHDAAPLIAQLRGFVQHADPVAQQLNQLVLNLRSRGVVESLLSFVYNAAAATARFDSISHLLPSHVLTSSCAMYATQPAAGCSAFFGAPRADRVHGRPRTPPPTSAANARSSSPSSPSGRSSSSTSSAAGALSPTQSSAPAAAGLAQQLLGGIANTIQSVPPAPRAPRAAQPIQSLLNYLLK